MPIKHKIRKTAVSEDFFKTPRSALEPIRRFIPKDVKTIWEPTHGLGDISYVLEEWGYTVVKTDLYPKTQDTTLLDFNSVTSVPENVDFIILNPPFSDKTRFLSKLCSLGVPFIMLVPLTVMETLYRVSLFRSHRLSILLLNRRVNYIDGKSVTFPSVWVLSPSSAVSPSSILHEDELKK